MSAPRTAQPVGRLREQKDTCWDGILTGQRLSSASPALTSVHFPQPASAPLPRGEPEGEGSALCRSLSLLSKGPVWGVTRSSPDWSLPGSNLDFGVPTSNLRLPHPGCEKGQQAYICAGRGSRRLLPYAGEGGVDFSREGARPGPGPRSSRHPPPLTSPESCQSQLRTGLCVLGRPRRGSRDRPGGAERSRGRCTGDQHHPRRDRLCPSPLPA